MKLLFWLLTVGIGFLITLHISMNAQVGSLTRNAYLANALFWLIGAASALLVGATHWDRQFLSDVTQLPAWLLLAGVIGALIAVLDNLILPVIGLSSLTLLLIFGQLLTSVAFSHYGILTPEAQPVNLVKIAGLALVLLGAGLVIYGKIPLIGRG